MNAVKSANDTKVKVRELQRTLYLAAKAKRSRRFHALYDKIYRTDVMWEAWRRVKANRGSAGVDGITIRHIVEKYGEERFVEEIQEQLRKGKYRPMPVRRKDIPKGDGKVPDHWVFPLSVTDWCRWPRKSCWSPSLRQTSRTVHSDSVRNVVPSRPSSGYARPRIAGQWTGSLM